MKSYRRTYPTQTARSIVRYVRRVSACESIGWKGKGDRRSSRRSLPYYEFDIIPYQITACASRNVGVVRNMCCIGHVRYVIIIIIIIFVHRAHAVVNVLLWLLDFLLSWYRMEPSTKRKTKITG